MALAANEAADFSRYFLVVEKFMKSTYNLLAHSSKRKAKFAEMQELNGESGAILLLDFVSELSTRRPNP
tara:strand:+ start:291 stop:497 length:207 start_codon:yes stop_codon:yes gene_type:complete